MQPRTLQEAIVYFSIRNEPLTMPFRFAGLMARRLAPAVIPTRLFHQDAQAVALPLGWNRQLTFKVNTIFEDSALGMDKLMTALWMLVNCKNGEHFQHGDSPRSGSYAEVGNGFKWLQRLREALHNRSFGFTRKMGGPGTELEADETYIGGVTKEYDKDRKARLWKRAGCMAVRLPSKEFLTVKRGKFALMWFPT